ncbi:choice-of-anchor G family protein, partial [Brachybacterium hainanense]
MPYSDTAAGAQPARGRHRPGWRPRFYSALAAGTVCAIVGAGASSASALGLDTYPDEPTEAEASVLGLEAGGTDAIALAQSAAGSATNPGPNREAFSGSVGGSEIVDLGAGYQIPLDQLVDFGQVGAVESESTATDGRNGEAITGLVGADGGLTLDGTDGDFGTASIDLLSVTDAAGVDTITDEMIDQADLTFGFVGANVEAQDGEFLDPDGVGGVGQYRVGEVKLNLHSPAIETAGDGVSDAAGQIEGTVEDTVNDALSAGSLLPGMTVETEVTSTIQQDVVDGIMLSPITTDDGLATLNLGDGTLEVDLGRIGGNDDGVIPDRPVGLNNQNPNTELIDSDTYPFVASSVHDVIEEVIDLSVGTAIQSLDSVSIHTKVTAPDGTVAEWDMDLSGEVTGYSCTPAGITGAVTCGTIDAAVGTMGVVMAPVNEALSDPNGILYEAFTTIKTDMITVPVRAAVDPFLELIADNLFSVQINHQVEQQCTDGSGAEGLTAVEVSALSFGVLDGTARLGFGNAGVRIDACATAVEPGVTAESPVPAGGQIDVTSDGWQPGSEVSLQLTDPEGNPVGEPVTVTTDDTGAIPAGTVVPVPEDVTPGDHTVVVSDADGNTGQATVTLYAPTLEVPGQAPAGTDVPVTSGGWVPGSEVTLQLTDPEGNPVGDPITVTADPDGSVPAGTVIPVPADATVGPDYAVVATDPTGAELTSALEVIDADATAPTVEASSPIPAGGETEVTSGGWTPGAEVTLQLTDPSGAPVGDPVTVTADGNGDLPAGTVLPIPADAPAGDYTVTASDPDGSTGEGSVSVYAPALEAPAQAPAGSDVPVTSTGWLPESEVTLQLTDPSGAPLGDPVVVTTDAEGALPEGTVVPVPADAPVAPGYTVAGTDANGANASAPLEVLDADATVPTVEASSPIPAGGETEVTSGGWNPGAEVTLQLTDADGNPVGDPVTATADENGDLPAGTVLSVPADAAAGDYTLTATDPDGASGETTVAVYAPAIQSPAQAPAGSDVPVTSTGWLPESEVTLQLTDPSGAPLGDPVVVTTDADGAVPAGTVVAVPADAPVAPGYTVAGTDANGANASAPLEVLDADAVVPTITATSPVRAGEDTTVTSGGWEPGTEVTLQLTDASGAPVGDPVVVTADDNGDLPAGTVLTVPADTPAGTDYAVVGTDANGTSVSAPLEVVDADAVLPTVEVSSPVPAGGEAGVVSGGWEPGSEVTLQL